MSPSTHQKHLSPPPNLTAFAIMIAVIEGIMIILYGIFVRVTAHNDEAELQRSYPMFQDVNVMMLVGFGFLMAYIRGYSWSALSYTFFINAVVVQLYILMIAFWEKVFVEGWADSKIHVESKFFTFASYCVASMLIAFGAPLGRVGPLQLLIMSLFGVVGYSLNEALVYNVLHTYDAGGSTAIHTFGCFFGVAFSSIIGRKFPPTKAFESSRVNSTFAMIGTLFLWLFWPSFNAAYFPENAFQRVLTISNTIISLTGSCLTAFVVSILIRKRLNMDDVLNGTLAGGVAIGASSSVCANMGIALLIGVLAGALATGSEIKLGAFMKRHKVYDTIGILYLHGLPGLFGGFVSAMVIASYQTPPGLQQDYREFLFIGMKRTYSQQAGIQVAATFMSMGISLVFGILAGLVTSCVYKLPSEKHFEDAEYFELPNRQMQIFEHEEQERILAAGVNESQKQINK